VKIQDEGIDRSRSRSSSACSCSRPGRRGIGALGGRASHATPTRTPKATAAALPSSPKESGTSWAVVLIVAVVGLVLGLVIATVFREARGVKLATLSAVVFALRRGRAAAAQDELHADRRLRLVQPRAAAQLPPGRYRPRHTVLARGVPLLRVRVGPGQSLPRDRELRARRGGLAGPDRRVRESQRRRAGPQGDRLRHRRRSELHEHPRQSGRLQRPRPAARRWPTRTTRRSRGPAPASYFISVYPAYVGGGDPPKARSRSTSRSRSRARRRRSHPRLRSRRRRRRPRRRRHLPRRTAAGRARRWRRVSAARGNLRSGALAGFALRASRLTTSTAQVRGRSPRNDHSGTPIDHDRP